LFDILVNTEQFSDGTSLSKYYVDTVLLKVATDRLARVLLDFLSLSVVLMLLLVFIGEHRVPFQF